MSVLRVWRLSAKSNDGTSAARLAADSRARSVQRLVIAKNKAKSKGVVLIAARLDAIFRSAAPSASRPHRARISAAYAIADPQQTSRGESAKRADKVVYRSARIRVLISVLGRIA